MKIAIAIFLLIELVAVIYSLKGLLNYVYEKTKMKYDFILQRCADDVEYRNKIASYIFFFQDMGPNISSFSIISIFISDRENITALIIIFFIGIMMKEKRSSKCQLEQ